MSGQPKLYTPELLARAVRLAEFPLREDFPLAGEARSSTCGSALRLGLACDDAGAVRDIGIRAQACAVGQAAAAIFADGAVGRDRTAMERSAAEIRDWLASPQTPLPDWPGLGPLAPARAYPARHGAIMLAWDAALRALSNPENGG